MVTGASSWYNKARKQKNVHGLENKKKKFFLGNTFMQ